MNPYLYVFLIAMLPFAELRGAIPYGIYAGLDPVWVYIIALIGNMVPVPFILLFLRDLEKFLRRYKRVSRIMDKIFERTYRKANDKVRKWEYLALILFVAVPLPGTGAWTGSLIAYLFKMDIKKSMVVIFLGVAIAGAVVLGLIYLGVSILS